MTALEAGAVLTRGSPGPAVGLWDAGPCAFCAEIAGEVDHNLFHQILGPEIGARYLLEEWGRFVVMPSIGALLPGYLLVLPRRHVRSFGHLTPGEYRELDELLAGLPAKLLPGFGDALVMYEHGPVAADMPAGSCADHAHLHVVPVPATVDLATPFVREFATRRLGGFSDLRGQVLRQASYLLLSPPGGPRLVADAPAVGSQYFRRELSHQLGRREEWDWVMFPQRAHLWATVDGYPHAGARR